MINPEQFSEWLEDPATLIVLKYLKDSATSEVELLTEGIKGGAILSEGEQIRVSTIIATLERISEIELEEIEEFYKIEE